MTFEGAYEILDCVTYHVSLFHFSDLILVRFLPSFALGLITSHYILFQFDPSGHTDRRDLLRYACVCVCVCVFAVVHLESPGDRRLGLWNGPLTPSTCALYVQLEVRTSRQSPKLD